MHTTKISRRRLAFWAGFGLITLGERIGVPALDDWAVTTISVTGPDPARPLAGDELSAAETSAGEVAEHWTLVRNAKWRWYEREHFVDGHWKTTGVSTPIDRDSGNEYSGRTGYLDESCIPDIVLSVGDRKRLGRPLWGTDSWQERHIGRNPNFTDSVGEPLDPETMTIDFGDRSESDAGRSSIERRSLHGRPPSKWLRSLTAKEIRIWLSKVEIQDAHVSGMTFWTHLTRDHSFDPAMIEGLTEPELAELHGAAHEGF